MTPASIHATPATVYGRRLVGPRRVFVLGPRTAPRPHVGAGGDLGTGLGELILYTGAGALAGAAVGVGVSLYQGHPWWWVALGGVGGAALGVGLVALVLASTNLLTPPAGSQPGGPS